MSLKNRPQHWLRLLLYAVLIAATLISSGCSLLSHPPGSSVDSSTAPDARALKQWSLDGKIGLRFLGENISATYRWQRLDQDFDAEASGPMGQGHTTVNSRNGLVTLENAWLGRHQSDNPEGMTKALTGIAIPLPYFNAWLMGWPADAHIAIQSVAAPEGVREFDEQNWHVRVLSEQVVAGYRIPARVVMTQGSNRLLLTVAHWQPGTAAVGTP